MIRDHLLNNHATITSEEQTDQLRTPVTDHNHTVQIHPGRNTDHPATITDTLKAVTETSTDHLRLRNQSPVIALEIHRHTPDNLQIQYSLETARQERKIRTQLTNHLDHVSFSPGTTGIPADVGHTIGCAYLTPSRSDALPLATDHEQPPLNTVIAALHEDAMQRTGFTIQILLKPVAGRPLHRRRWHRRSRNHADRLRTPTPTLLGGEKKPGQDDKDTARATDRKRRKQHYLAAIQILITGAEEYTPARVEEVATTFNVFDNGVTGQQLHFDVYTHILQSRIHRFAKAVAERRYWAPRFHVDVDEAAALVAPPDRVQGNVETAEV